jgi:hypothetical protein
MDVLEYLTTILPTREMVDNFIDAGVYDDPERNNYGVTYCSELGWVRKNAARCDGINGCRTSLSYTGPGINGARTYSLFGGSVPRINTFGDSFTHCDQVSDGETWQEYLAHHIREPVINFGVGGYSVYQAFLRMKLVGEADPAEYVILNIWEDDHFRNLDAWRSIRFGSPTPGGWTLPHVRVDVGEGLIEERRNYCSTPDELYGLCDIEGVAAMFDDDPVLKLILASANDDPVAQHEVAVSIGLSELGETILGPRRSHAQAALFATQRVLDFAEDLTRERGQKLMVVLSYGRQYLQDLLEGKPRWDQEFLNTCGNMSIPILDLATVYEREFNRYRGSPSEFLSPYFNGHHTPAGNFFFARSMRGILLGWLDPKPPAYTRLTPMGDYFPSRNATD